jgi:hypothetical protein
MLLMPIHHKEHKMKTQKSQIYVIFVSSFVLFVVN